MNYRITITRTEPNPAYAAQVEEMEKNRRYTGNRFDETSPRPEVTMDVLVTEITPEQFSAVRKAVLSNF
jgi:hypothetical protein